MRVNSYDRLAVRPRTGTLWVWEPVTAPALIKVLEVRWNGEEWWIKTVSLADYTTPPALRRPAAENWNDLSRFWEACHHVAMHAGPPGARGALTRRGEPRPEEEGEPCVT